MNILSSRSTALLQVLLVGSSAHIASESDWKLIMYIVNAGKECQDRGRHAHQVRPNTNLAIFARMLHLLNIEMHTLLQGFS